MYFFVAPYLATPLLKVPLLLSNAICTYHGYTPPRPPPNAKEQNRFTRSDWMTKNARILAPIARTIKWTLCGASIVEAVALLLDNIAIPWPHSYHILSLLFPHPDTSPSSLRITFPTALGCVVGISGGLLRVWCYRALGRFFTWQMAIRDDHELITSGPYSIVRHPSYAAQLIMLAGNALVIFGPGSYFTESRLGRLLPWRMLATFEVVYLAIICATLVNRTGKEDDVLKQEFGSQWETWAERTPYKLFPFVY